MLIPSSEVVLKPKNGVPLILSKRTVIAWKKKKHLAVKSFDVQIIASVEDKYFFIVSFIIYFRQLGGEWLATNVYAFTNFQLTLMKPVDCRPRVYFLVELYSYTVPSSLCQTDLKWWASKCVVFRVKDKSVLFSFLMFNYTS